MTALGGTVPIAVEYQHSKLRGGGMGTTECASSLVKSHVELLSWLGAADPPWLGSLHLSSPSSTCSDWSIGCHRSLIDCLGEHGESQIQLQRFSST